MVTAIVVKGMINNYPVLLKRDDGRGFMRFFLCAAAIISVFAAVSCVSSGKTAENSGKKTAEQKAGHESNDTKETIQNNTIAPIHNLLPDQEKKGTPENKSNVPYAKLIIDKKMVVEKKEMDLHNYFSFQVTKKDDKTLLVTAGKRHFTFTFKNKIVNIRPNTTYPILAVDTTSLDDDEESKKFTNYRGDELFILDLKSAKKHKIIMDMNSYRQYDIWSQNGTYTAIVQGSLGPVDIVETRNLMHYLQGNKKPFYQIDLNRNASSHNPAKVSTFHSWLTDDVLLFDAGCCGDIWRYQFDLKTRLMEIVECAEGYCNYFFSGDTPGILFREDDINFSGNWLDKPKIFSFFKNQVAERLRHCLLKENTASEALPKSCLAVTFWVGSDGKIDNATIESTTALNEQKSKETCIAQSLKEASFNAPENAESSMMKLLVSVGSNGMTDSVCLPLTTQFAKPLGSALSTDEELYYCARAEQEFKFGNVAAAAEIFDYVSSNNAQNFEALYGSARAYALLAVDDGVNCDARYLILASERLKQARETDATLLKEKAEKEADFNAIRSYPMFLNAVYDYTFINAPSLEPFIVEKIYQTNCTGSGYCPIETLELSSEHTFIRTFHKNGIEFSDCLNDPAKNPPDKTTACRLEIGMIKGTWRIKGKVLEFFDDKRKPLKQITVDRPNIIDGLWFPDPNDGSTNAQDNYENSCQYFPEPDIPE